MVDLFSTCSPFADGWVAPKHLVYFSLIFSEYPTGGGENFCWASIQNGNRGLGSLLLAGEFLHGKPVNV